MAEMPFMPVKVPDILGDAGDLPNPLFGGYCKLLFRWWAKKALPEPNEKRLARWASMSSAEFDDLKEFLTETEKGWIQKRMMRTYAECLGKSIKATNSANARIGKALAKEVIDERIAKGYALRQLSIKHEPIVGANAPTQKEKNKNKKEKSGDVSRETTELEVAYPDDPEERRFCQAVFLLFGRARYTAWFQEGGKSIIRKNGEGYVVEPASETKHDMIVQRHMLKLQDVAESLGTTIRIAPPKAA